MRTYPPHMQHEIWTDGVVLFGEMSALATMRPDGLSLWHVVRFTLKNASPAERNRLSRRLHGMGARPGVLAHRPTRSGAARSSFPPTRPAPWPTCSTRLAPCTT
ncbi:MAG TPA: hypothetical protein VFC93_08270 [Chloroflexota bacterium]|nr:hypothetical protein [Chloroflexota bacterium]